MKVLRRYFETEIYQAVLFVLVAFLALFAFFDMMSEVRFVGGPYRLEHAFLYVSLGLPTYAYELMPIAALIGTIYVMAQFASRSEFTVMRASSLSMATPPAISSTCGAGASAIAAEALAMRRTPARSFSRTCGL